MIKRLTWFVGGVVAGVAGLGTAKRKARAVASDLAPAAVARRATDTVRQRVRHLGDAVRDGRSAMHMRETELRARLDGRAVSLADELDDGDTVLVDGRPVEPGQVIVLRQMPDSARQADHSRDPSRDPSRDRPRDRPRDRSGDRGRRRA